MILTTDPHETMGYGREKYNVHIVQDDERGPYALYATQHRWKGNDRRDQLEIEGVSLTFLSE